MIRDIFKSLKKAVGCEENEQPHDELCQAINEITGEFFHSVKRRKDLLIKGEIPADIAILNSVSLILANVFSTYEIELTDEDISGLMKKIEMTVKKLISQHKTK